MKIIWATVLFLAALPLGATQIQWSAADNSATASLNVYLNGESSKKTVSRNTAGWINLTLSKTMYAEDDLTIVVKNEGKVWMTKHKKVSQDISNDKIYLPGGKSWSLEICGQAGNALATVTFQ